MAKNPMQRKAQNSFLLGMLITLLITGIIIALLGVKLTQMTKEQKAYEKSLKEVYVIKDDIKSGEILKKEQLKEAIVDSACVPSNALTLEDIKNKTNIKDKDGNIVKKIDVISKINLKKGTIVTTEMIAEQGELSNDVRKQEFNMIKLLSQIQSGDYVDIRFRLPSGKDYIVVSHKRLTIPDIDGIESADTISFNLDEAEILTLSCAIIENYKIEGSVLYVTQYVEPGLQTAAVPTYLPDEDVRMLIERDPNCVETAKNAIRQRNENAGLKDSVRNPINSELNDMENAENAKDNTINKLEEELKKSQEERKKYLESLGE